MLHTFAVGDYRSLRDLVLPLRPLTLVTGPNGSGKSNIYRALRLLAGAAQGQLIASLAREGGLQSTLWAGPEQPSRTVRAGDHPLQGTTRQRSLSASSSAGVHRSWKKACSSASLRRVSSAAYSDDSATSGGASAWTERRFMDWYANVIAHCYINADDRTTRP